MPVPPPSIRLTVTIVGDAAHAQRTPPAGYTRIMVRPELRPEAFNNYVIKWNKLNKCIKTEDSIGRYSYIEVDVPRD